MKITINVTDHRYNTYNFEEVDKLPEIGNIIDIPGDIRQTVDSIIDVTDRAARSDFGDCQCRLYIVYYHDESYVYDEDEDGNEFVYLEENGISFKCFAVKEG